MKAKIKKYLDKINWRITEPIKTMTLGYENDEPIPVPKEVLSHKLNIIKGDRVVLVYDNLQPIITCPIKGKTVKNLFESISAGMKIKISPHNTNTQSVYQYIGNFIKPKQRMKMIKLYEDGKVTPRDLVDGNYEFYEGHLKRQNGVWMYATGS